MAVKTKKKDLKINKKLLWLGYFLDEQCKTTFLNKKESARKVYDTKNEESLRSIGYENFILLADKINEWLDDVGLSENALKIKLLSLVEAKETKFFQKDGKITDQIDVEAIETQRRSLDMAMKVRGMFEKDNSQKNGPTRIKVTHTVEEIKD